MASVEAYVCIIHQSYSLLVHTVAPNTKCMTLHIVGWQWAMGSGQFVVCGSRSAEPNSHRLDVLVVNFTGTVNPDVLTTSNGHRPQIKGHWGSMTKGKLIDTALETMPLVCVRRLQWCWRRSWHHGFSQAISRCGRKALPLTL
jgi:hypothetical protein